MKNTAATQNPTPQEQIAYHREAIADLSERASVCDVCCQPKSAAHWRSMIAAAESCIRACERRIASEVN